MPSAKKAFDKFLEKLPTLTELDSNGDFLTEALNCVAKLEKEFKQIKHSINEGGLLPNEKGLFEIVYSQRAINSYAESLGYLSSAFARVEEEANLPTEWNREREDSVEKARAFKNKIYRAILSGEAPKRISKPQRCPQDVDILVSLGLVPFIPQVDDVYTSSGGGDVFLPNPLLTESQNTKARRQWTIRRYNNPGLAEATEERVRKAQQKLTDAQSATQSGALDR